jgi:uncharacterized protein
MAHWLLRYTFADDYLTSREPFRGEHLALGWQAADAGTLLLGGAVGNPPATGLLLFNDEAAARAFAAADPYVTHGVVTAWEVLPWTTVIGEQAATPIRPQG